MPDEIEWNERQKIKFELSFNISQTNLTYVSNWKSSLLICIFQNELKKHVNQKQKFYNQILQRYGGDIQRGTHQRINTAISTLPPPQKLIADLYRTVSQYETLTPSQKERLPLRDVSRFEQAQLELDQACQDIGWTRNDAHNVLQRITWDASADAKAYRADTGIMPDMVRDRVRRACEEIAKAVRDTSSMTGGGRCLDVGCGHGTLIPMLVGECGLGVGEVVGIDLSEEMVRNAKERHRGVTFLAGDFLKESGVLSDYEQRSGEEEEEGGFDGILFCSSLHDLPDYTLALTRAAELTRPNGVVVVLHAQGGAHVLGQAKANPTMVRRGLPSKEELEEVGKKCGLEVKYAPAEVGEQREEEEGYYVVLKKV